MAGENGSPGDAYQTFAGGGFGSLIIAPSKGANDTPEVVSRRAYLRSELPALYQDGDFGMRFIGALEGVLDPIVALLDSLPAHFDPDLAPRDVLELLGTWLGVELDEGQSVGERREIVRRAAELGRRRGTVGGLELALSLNFPGVPLRVEDAGAVLWSTSEQAIDPPSQQFVVYCDEPVPEETQAAIARCIEQFKPVHVPYRLRVRASKRTDG